jgi:hypothetical protein
MGTVVGAAGARFLGVAPGAHEAGLAQLPQVVADQVLGQPQGVHHLAVAQLPGHQPEEDPPARGVGHQTQEGAGGRGDVLRRGVGGRGSAPHGRWYINHG